MIRTIGAPRPVRIGRTEPLVGYAAMEALDGRLRPFFLGDVKLGGSGRLHPTCPHDGTRFGALCSDVHPPPASWCSCGVWASLSPHPILSIRGRSVVSALALVQVWGHTVFGTHGVRAQHGQLLAVARPAVQPRAQAAPLRQAATAMDVPYVSERQLLAQGARGIERTVRLTAQGSRALLHIPVDASAPPALCWFRFGPTGGQLRLCPWIWGLDDAVPVDAPFAVGHLIRRRGSNRLEAAFAYCPSDVRGRAETWLRRWAAEDGWDLHIASGLRGLAPAGNGTRTFRCTNCRRRNYINAIAAPHMLVQRAYAKTRCDACRRGHMLPTGPPPARR